MTLAVEFVHQLFGTGKEEPTNLVIFSDSQSALEALKNQQSRNVEVLRLTQSIDNLHKSYKVNIKFQWVPGDTQILQAIKLQTNEQNREQVKNNQTSLSTKKPQNRSSETSAKRSGIIDGILTQ